MIGPAKKLARLLRMARILARHDALLPREYEARAPASLRILARIAGGRVRATRQMAAGQRLALAFEQMGPSAIKLGQFLATRPDLIGSEVARGLESLQDRLPPFPDAAAMHGGAFARQAAAVALFRIRRSRRGGVNCPGAQGGNYGRSAAPRRGKGSASGH